MDQARDGEVLGGVQLHWWRDSARNQEQAKPGTGTGRIWKSLFTHKHLDTVDLFEIASLHMDRLCLCYFIIGVTVQRPDYHGSSRAPS
jgi:hypothetical protein